MSKEKIDPRCERRREWAHSVFARGENLNNSMTGKHEDTGERKPGIFNSFFGGNKGGRE
jgi:hypothetical protein